jgi:hypothetical protein
MPFYKTTKNIFIDHGEYFDQDWMNYEEVYVPSNKKWDYKEELKLEDVDLWEIIWESDFGIYAAYEPYAEFFLLKYPLSFMEDHPELPPYETFYGKLAQQRLLAHLSKWKIQLPINKIWVDDDELWLYNK